MEKDNSLVFIRQARCLDFDRIWEILQPVFLAGETYPHPPDMTKDEAYKAWMELPAAAYIAENNSGEVIGTYHIKTNQIGLGSHVCNCGYVVSEAARGLGLGKKLCNHSISEAKKLGFKAMQYNLVVSTNKIAIKTWQSCGFSIVGTIPKAFNHKKYGYVDAHIMYQWLG